MIRKFNLFIAGSFLAWTSVVYAGFDIIRDNELEGNPNKYGHGHTLAFHKALEGDERVSINEEQAINDQDALIAEAPKIGHTAFASVHLGRPHTVLKNLKNTGSTSPTLVPTKASVSDHLFNLSMAWGYRSVRWAVDAELLFAEGIDVVLSPFYQGTATSLNGSVNSYAMLFNLHYFFPRYYSWIPEAFAPHINFGIGPNFKRTKAQVLENNQTLATKTKNNVGFAFNLGVGLAYRITHHFLVDLTWRYIDYNGAKFGPTGTTIGGTATNVGFKAKDFRSSGFQLGLLYEMS